MDDHADVPVVEEDPLWVEKLVAKARAPVKREFLHSAPTRSAVPASGAAAEAPKISSVKKSKRQLKRERTQTKKSAENICAVVAKTGDVNACSFGEDCRFNHDLESYLSQKPPDLQGNCPFLALEKRCPFGIRCRFYGTHPKTSTQESVHDEDAQGDEMNTLNKEFQKLLWKNTVAFPKADAQLKSLGLLNKLKEKFTPKTTGKEAAEDPDSVVEPEGPVVKKQKSDASDLPDCHIGAVSGDDKLDAGDVSMRDELDRTEVPLLNEADIVDNVAVDEPQNGFYVDTKLNGREKKRLDFKGKLYLAPLTTVGNLPFRRLCKGLGADVTCGEMALCSNLLQGQASEWALLKRHRVEDVFGVQICGAHADSLARTAEIIDRECNVDFIDINLGCPIDIVVNKGAGSCLLTKPTRLEQIVKATSAVLDAPLTLKVRTGYFEGRNCAHSMVPEMDKWGAAAVTIHGRTRQQRYSKLADWEYVYDCARRAPEGLQVLGNGDVFSYLDWNEHLSAEPRLSSCMIARGALIKPWLFTEIKEQRHWDITSGERLEFIRDYARFGLEHWGSDTKGVETTRRFLLEWLSYTHRYIPVGLLEVIPQKLNWRPPSYFGRNDLETLMASESAADWVRISEMVLGPAPAGFVFTPKHKSNAYDKAENG